MCGPWGTSCLSRFACLELMIWVIFFFLSQEATWPDGMRTAVFLMASLLGFPLKCRLVSASFRQEENSAQRFQWSSQRFRFNQCSLSIDCVISSAQGFARSVLFSLSNSFLSCVRILQMGKVSPKLVITPPADISLLHLLAMCQLYSPSSLNSLTTLWYRYWCWRRLLRVP